MRQQVVEDFGQHILGFPLFRLQRLAVVERLIQEALGFATLLFHLGTETRQPLGKMAQLLQTRDPSLLNAAGGVFD